MGFGSFFRGVGRAIGRGVEKVGDFAGSRSLSSIGRAIQDACAEKVAKERSYDKNEAKIDTTERLNEILVSFSEGYFQHATTIEKNCVRLVEDYYDKLIEIIENAPGSVNNAASLRALKSGKKKISKTITGGIKEPLSKRMSLDDSRCLSILKMNSGVEKKKAMTSFTREVIKGALDNLSGSVRAALDEQTEDVQDYFSGIVEEQERTMQAFKEQFDKMIIDDELQQNDQEKNCVAPMFIISASDRVVEILK